MSCCWRAFCRPEGAALLECACGKHYHQHCANAGVQRVLMIDHESHTCGQCDSAAVAAVTASLAAAAPQAGTVLPDAAVSGAGAPAAGVAAPPALPPLAKFGFKIPPKPAPPPRVSAPPAPDDVVVEQHSQAALAARAAGSALDALVKLPLSAEAAAREETLLAQRKDGKGVAKPLDRAAPRSVPVLKRKEDFAEQPAQAKKGRGASGAAVCKVSPRVRLQGFEAKGHVYHVGRSLRETSSCCLHRAPPSSASSASCVTRLATTRRRQRRTTWRRLACCSSIAARERTRDPCNTHICSDNQRAR